ncbi:hypothetical protein [Salegentibacter chungangensis]|uniref:Cbb3-type cytochrome oxidase assembly protein CcoS n=1 Tax=Salegentibacter chungangensis TaxID=1335724 RepID=A0ABW3NQZ4_9FLAO
MSTLFIIILVLASILIPIGIFFLGYYAGKELGVSKKLFEINKKKGPEEDN